MTSYQADRKPAYKPKFEQKSKAVAKFNFVFDEQQVDYRTQIPDLPSKLRPKPNQESHNKKVEQIKSKIESLKQQRKAKKQEYKKGSQNFEEEISTFKTKIELGKKCIVVLTYDLESVQKSQAQVEQKIQKKTKFLRNLQRGTRQVKQEKKKYEEMTYQQLEAEEDRLSSRITTASLTKKQETQINNLIAKLIRLKQSAPHGEKPRDNTQQIENTQGSLDRLRKVKENLSEQQSNIRYKLQCIEESVDQFKDEIQQLQEQKKNQQTETLYEQAQKLKAQIYELREQLANIVKEHEKKKTEFQYEQAKVQWIKWAAEVKKRKNQQWEAEREQRRKQRLREKNKGEGKDDKKKQEVVDGQLKPERKKFNKNQKQIDNCTFLISYCEGLIQKNEPPKKQESAPVQQKKIEDVLKSGQWAKVKDAQIIKSKKNKQEQEVIQKPKKKKQVKAKQQQKTQEEQQPTTFNHQFFIQHYFDSVRLVPPTTPEQVQAILKQLQEKLNYYLQNPDIRQERQKQEPRQEKPKYTAEKFAKAKNNPRQKKVVNTEEFPHLS